MTEYIDNFYNDGFHIFKKVFTANECLSLKDYLKNNIKPKVFIPYSNSPWGYGNLIDDEKFKFIIENETILNFCENLLGNKRKFNHLVVNNKSSWIGPDVEWHQEAFNINTYAPGNDEKDWKKFSQIFIPLDDQNSSNGGLKIIPKSHLEGILPYEDFISPNLTHKRRVKVSDLNRLEQKYGVKSLELEAGDVLVFNHLLIHGSSNNLTNNDRMAIVLQCQGNIKPKDDLIFDAETEFRKNFVLKALKEKVNEIEQKDIYGDFKK